MLVLEPGFVAASSLTEHEHENEDEELERDWLGMEQGVRGGRYPLQPPQKS